MNLNENISPELLNDIKGLATSQKYEEHFTVGPLRRGEGKVLAHMFRQFLMNMVKAHAICGIKIKNVNHPFTAIPKIREDVYKIISNLKKVVVVADTTEDFTITLQANEAGIVTAENFVAQDGVRIVNPEQEICTITEPTEIEIECLVQYGAGYVSEDQMSVHQKDGGMWLIGGNFAAVEHVNTEIKDVLAGRAVNLEELKIEVQTNGSILPQEAMKQVVTRVHELLGGLVDVKQDSDQEVQATENALTFDKVLLEPVSVLNLSARAQACIDHFNIKRLGDLVIKSPKELLSVPYVGQNSVNEIIEKLSVKGLSLETIISGWETEA